MKAEELAHWHWTRAGRRLRQRVVDPISHEDYRRMIRETYPAQLPSRDLHHGWWERFEPVTVEAAEDAVRNAEWMLERSRRIEGQKADAVVWDEEP